MSVVELNVVPDSNAATGTAIQRWALACALDELEPELGLCAQVDGEQVAVFRLADDTLYAVGNYDPFSYANVLSRGIVGSIGGRPVIASPLYKQHFDLETGICIEDETVRLPVYAVHVLDGAVFLKTALTPTPLPEGEGLTSPSPSGRRI